MITSQSMKAGFTGGLVVDFPNSTKAKKFFLVLMTGGSQPLPQVLCGFTKVLPVLHHPIPYFMVKTSVADPDPNPDPLDPYVFGPLGSGYISQTQRYGSGSGSFHHQAKIVRKTLIPIAL